MSTTPLWKSVTYNTGAAAVPPSTQPLKTAFALELSTVMIAAVAFTELFHPEIVPSSVQKRKLAAFPVATGKDVVVFAMTPLTAPPVGLVGMGIVTTSATAAPVVPYSVEVPEPLLPIQNGLVAVVAKPHGLTRFGS